MKDISGKKLKVGQKVKWGKAYFSTMGWWAGRVDRFTAKSVKIVFRNRPCYLSQPWVYVQDPENRVIILEK